MDNSTEATRQLLENMLYMVCDEYLKRIVKATGLDKERAEALRAIVLRPNDVQVLTAIESAEGVDATDCN
jgi:hypothetical protein